MPSASIDAYVDAFVARCAVEMGPDDPVVEGPGARGVLCAGDNARIRLIVTDDRAYDRLAALIPDVQAGVVQVFAAASRCADLLRSTAEWKPERPTTAMVHRDLQSLPRPMLPSGLTLAIGAAAR